MKKFCNVLLLIAGCLGATTAFTQNFNLTARSTLTIPGQTLANICGYAQGGREYALLGASQGMIVVDVTNPDNPVNIVQIPGPNNLWKEIKVYDHYAYVTSEGGSGLQIVDLSPLPSAALPYHNYTGDGEIAGQLNTIHALHIDVTAGFVYLHGSNLFNGGPVILDLNADPYNPTYAGKYDQLDYVHDGYADNDTLYACHIYDGTLAIVDVSDKQNPEVLGTVVTPGEFTHNSWLLDDHKTVLTTDEATPSFVTAYDISDPTDIRELDRVSTNNGNNSIGHNTHVRDNWAITSWYTDGVVIIDAHKPDNLVITGWYDTWPQATGPDFDGCWGAFPFFPSGTIVTSDIQPGKLTVLTPNYVRACYVEGTVKSGCNGQALSNVQVTINSNDPFFSTTSDLNGIFKTGQAAPGNFTVTLSKAGYTPYTANVTLAPGQVTTLDVTLEADAYDIAGTVLDAATNQPLANAQVELSGPVDYTLQTGNSGQFNLECVAAGSYEVTAGVWGYKPGVLTVNANGSATVYLDKGYYDGFALDLGWTKTSTASSGAWERGVPEGTEYDDQISNPETDAANDTNNECYVTGLAGGGAGSNDVDNGTVTLTSPVMQLAGSDDAILTFRYWFFNDGGNSAPNDNLTVTVSNGTQTATVLTQNQSQSLWRYSGEIHLGSLLPLTDNVRVSFTTADEQQSGHLLEAGVDVFEVVVTGASGTQNIDRLALLNAAPNPTASDFSLQYEWPYAEGLSLDVHNLIGQPVFTQQLNGRSGTIRLGGDWPNGIYLAMLRSADGRQSVPVKLVKQN